MADALRPLHLTHVQFVLLASAWWLGQPGPPPSQLAVAGHADTNVKMTSEVLRKLEDRGLVVQHTDAGDRRAKAISVTAEGAALAQRAIEVVEVVERADADFFATAPAGLVPALQALADLGSRPRPARPKSSE